MKFLFLDSIECFTLSITNAWCLFLAPDVVDTIGLLLRRETCGRDSCDAGVMSLGSKSAAGHQTGLLQGYLLDQSLLALSYVANDVPSKLSVIELGGLWQIVLLDLSYAANDMPLS
ncbi:hypothetical protein F3Y22_tig00112491pilonHSYRG00349 [Hibiscus syriacus]|uniref:Uncharacterized protein n=1 Tax=Hibiscus syriacus TaxID=106335 RepID=A0A6A2Y3N3_HIBSY|nr:hypothetical protein F3Y22_tig00112491pilonHSYRG00349 [Hibiscus syriacus]